MPFEGKYCWQIATMGYLSENSPPPLPPPPPSTEVLNFAL